MACLAALVAACATPADPSHEARAIERLHRKDREASLAKDFATLRDLCDEHAVLLPPGGPPLAGRHAIEHEFASMAEEMADLTVVEYDTDFVEVEILGDTAWEWGFIRVAVRRDGRGSGKGGAGRPDEVRRSTYKLVRVLRRQPDGTWKIFRSIWNDAPANQP